MKNYITIIPRNLQNNVFESYKITLDSMFNCELSRVSRKSPIQEQLYCGKDF